MNKKLPSHAGPCLALLAALSTPVLGQVTTRVSVGSGGIQGDEDSYAPALSASGRYVAFYSEASNLVPGDTNDAEDIFLRDRHTDTTIRISVNAAGVEGDGDCYNPVLSANGRVVAYYSEASNLVPGDTNGADDVFVYDVPSGTTTRVSVDSTGVEGDGASIYPSISADGRYVVFHSWATNLVPGDTNGVPDVFIHDLAYGVTRRVSVGAGGIQGNGRSEYPTISADGRKVAFESWASNFAPGDTNTSADIFLRDLDRGALTCVSVDASGLPGNKGCSYSCISPDGRSVAFGSWSSNLVAGDTNNLTDAFVRDVATGTTTLVSVSSSGQQGNGISLIHTLAAFSHDGRFVVFKSAASNLVAGDTNGAQDIFLRDRWHGTTTRVNVSTRNEQAQGITSSQPTISANGRHIAFYSYADNLVPDDTNGVPDAFVRSLK